jgi:hypothetical protein
MRQTPALERSATSGSVWILSVGESSSPQNGKVEDEEDYENEFAN